MNDTPAAPDLPPLPPPAHPTHALGPLWTADQMRDYAHAAAHPAPVAAPDADEIMALADQIREKAQGSMDAPFWRHVAAAVEKLIARWDAKQFDYETELQQERERAERAELRLTAAHQLQREHTEQILRLSGERDEALALLKEARQWAMEHLGIPPELLARIDALTQRP